MTKVHMNRRQTWKFLAGAILTSVVLLAHQVLPDQVSALADEIIHSLHGPGFGVVALLILSLLRGGKPPAAAYFRAGIYALLLAGLAEAAQIPGPRAAEMKDLVADTLGILGFLGAAALIDRNMRRSIGKMQMVFLSIVSIPALLAAIVPTLWLSYALVLRSQLLPQLLSFDEPWERTYFSGDEMPLEIVPAPDGWPDGSGNIARLHTAGQWGLMLHLRPYPDWSDYSVVSFVAATTDGRARRIAVGLWGIRPGDNTQPGRYYTTVTVGPNPARICVSFSELDGLPSGRRFDLAHVSELLLGSAKNRIGEELLVDDFRLDKSVRDCPSTKEPTE